LFPAIAVAQALSRNAPDTQLLYVGLRGGMEEKLVPRYDVPLETIVAPKLDMETPWRNWSVPFVAPLALVQSARIVRRFRPDVVLGTGGYVSAPIILAAAAGRSPIVLQEQNLLPGRTTRWLSRLARVVATGYEESARYLHARCVVTGTPVRKEFTVRREQFPPRPQRLLVLGGSQGAHRINKEVAALLFSLTRGLRLIVWHQTGDRDLAEMEAVRARLTQKGALAYRPFAFADNLAERVRAADLVLSRAGASAISEVSAVGIPMVLVPGQFAGGHQRLNAEPFVRAGAAVIAEDDNFLMVNIGHEVSRIVKDQARYRSMVDAMRGMGRPRAADDVAALLQEVARR
jgi:UDP-N-acetylglucosamine--N-acetylmuramyl-(pentapeptide) pyrophosphoryl-undecaprenol N-acetylglucosamine transferase